jgi:hypothetical protein
MAHAAASPVTTSCPVAAGKAQRERIIIAALSFGEADGQPADERNCG